MTGKKDLKRFKIGVGGTGVEVQLEKYIEDIPPGHIRMVEIGIIRKKLYLIANNGQEIVVIELPSYSKKVYEFNHEK